MMYNYLDLKLPSTINKNLYIGNVLPNAYSLLLANIAQHYPGLLVVLAKDFNIAYQLEAELITFIPKEQATIFNILHFPDWETLPFDNFSPHPSIISERLATLYNLPMVERGILIVPMVTLMHKLCPPEYIKQNVLIIDTNSILALDDFRFNLEQAGYIRVPQVMGFGEFAIRGSIIDLFPIGSKLPYRIDLLDNKVDSIRTFNIDTQRTIEKISNIRILPAQEYPFNQEAIKKFRTNWRSQFSIDPNNSQIYQDVSKGFKSPGLEYYLPLFFDKTSSLFDYLPKNCLIVRTKDCVPACQEFFSQANHRFEQFCHDTSRSILPVNQLFFNSTQIFSLIKQFTQIICSAEIIENISDNDNSSFNLAIDNLPDPITNLFDNQINNINQKKIFCVESKGRKEIFRQLINKSYPNIRLQEIEDFSDFFSVNIDNAILITQLINGFILKQSNTAIVCEADLSPQKITTTTRKRDKQIDPDLSIRNLMEINIGDPIVHVEHGVGRYLGLTQLDYGQTMGEFLVVEYADKNKLYVPITSLNLIHRYSGVDLEHAPLHKLGTDRWQKEKKKASQQIKDTAAHLLEIYAVRASKTGMQHVVNQQSYQKFIDLFLFTDTVDQTKASLDVIADLTSDKPMDRVICGDVGFGKTEIAMRAAFIVAENNKQIAILAPTTLLAQQHYQTFLDRFADFPIQIELLSRFVDNKKQKAIIDKIAKGTCDIVIGTHRLLQKDLKFKSLGLLIIDEEHKFGVEQKEKFKKLRAEVDVLALTATPIPRTLNMAMSGIRDISIIATPPNHRLSVKTFVREFNIEIIKEAIMRELQRGGQVYYLYNKVASINKIAIDLQNLVPQANIKIAHGQMNKKDLEHVMIDFYHRKFNVLVCTTIIENGIDIPTANTIIIDRADCFGLSQLHQLRGRVGRSHHQAYAFCFTPNRSSLTDDAIKRLDAIENLDTLGIGFTLATHDLEIRGSGELLGSEQSGNIQTVGFSLYMELLEHAISYLKQNKDLNNLENSIITEQIEIDLQIPAFIPTVYIPDVHTRLILYKKISKARTEHRLNELISEFIDRFGLLPIELQNLFAITKLKILSEELGVTKIKYTNTGCNIEFAINNKVDVDKIIGLLQKHPNKYKLISNNKLCCLGSVAQDSRVDFVSRVLGEISC